MASSLLTKSRYMNGLQCPRLLWLAFNDPSKIPSPDASTLHIFDQGRIVGEMARKLYPGGVTVPFASFKTCLSQTRELLNRRVPLFEPGFLCDTLYSRLDILSPCGKHGWDLVEVKSSTSVKDENIHDVSFQKLCADKEGLKIEHCYLAYINNRYVRNGELDPKQLFSIQDISEEVEAVSDGIEDRVNSMLEVIAQKECPDMPVGKHCSFPYECQVRECWNALPENNIFTLYRGGDKCFDLMHSGIFLIKNIPLDFRLSAAQKIQRTCDIKGTAHIQAKEIRDFLDALVFPLYYLDFETINPAVPLFNGTRPYQRIPFQFSLHTTASAGDSNPRHYGFLAEGRDDPRPQFLRQLKERLGGAGSIVTYNQAFEEGVLKELAEAFPEYGDWITEIRKRLVDLLVPFRSFSYYHPAQNGSASIKHVLPALTGKSYEGMDIAEGDAASRAFLNATWGEVTDQERSKIRCDLEKYCCLDTEAMIMIVNRLREIVQTP